MTDLWSLSYLPVMLILLERKVSLEREDVCGDWRRMLWSCERGMYPGRDHVPDSGTTASQGIMLMLVLLGSYLWYPRPRYK